jgi:hypothetical protein
MFECGSVPYEDEFRIVEFHWIHESLHMLKHILHKSIIITNVEHA